MSRDMSEMILFVGTYNIPEGRLDAFHDQAQTMTEMVRDHEPRVLLVGHFLNEDETEGTSIHLHPDADSFDFHIKTASRLIDRGARILDVTRIELYGQPHDATVDQLSKGYHVQVKTWAAGYSRLNAE